MKCYATILPLILALKFIHTDSSQECPKDNYIIIDENGDKIVCLPCQACVVGRGLTPSCGLKLTEAQKANIKCLPCEPGKTYSNQHGPSSCKSCQICPVTLKNCTAESNTQCSKDCGRGYYYDNSTYNCQPCSYCCRKDNKRIAECVGLQAQCSVHDALECSPKTTKNPRPSSTHDGSTGDDEGIKTDILIVIIVAVVVVIIVAVGVYRRVVRCRKQRLDAEHSPEQVPLDNRPNNCGITKTSFVVIVNHPLTPGNEVQEGKVLSLICENQGIPENEDCFDNCNNYIYDWKKDMMDDPCHEQKIDFNPVQVKDFGKYTCQVKCRQHPHQSPADANKLDLDVVPEPTKRYKNFTEINSLEVYEKIADMLKYPARDIGDWERVAEQYSMASSKRQSLKGDDLRGMQVIEYLIASQTRLTVYDFCKFMKTIKQNQIVELLENHLTCEIHARDSRYCLDFNGAHSSSSLVVPGGGQNNPGLNDSRQGSRDELAGNSYHGSAGSGSASNSVIRTAKGLIRQISQNSSYKKHENEDRDPP